jgi:hypothetical protein
MSSLRDSKLWDRQLEQGLPDSRLSGTNRENKTIVYARKLWEKVFCASCSKPGGIVTKESFPHVFYLCDDCSKYGPPPGTIEVRPDGATIQYKPE